MSARECQTTTTGVVHGQVSKDGYPSSCPSACQAQIPSAVAVHSAAMHGDMVSQTSSLVSNERQLVLQLLLTTLSGEEHQVIIDLQEFDRLDEFEHAVLEQLPTIGGSSTFGCELTFVQRDTGQLLRNPVWDTLRDRNQFHLVVRQFCCRAEHKGQLKRNAKAIQVPPTRSG